MEMVVCVGREREVEGLTGSKYRMDLEWSQILVKFQSWWWKDLHKVCTDGEGGGWFQQQLAWRLGGGDKAKF